MNYQEELNNLLTEYSLVSAMTEEQACEFMNADSKSDALEVIQEEIDYYRCKVEEEELEETGSYLGRLDEAFGSWEQVNRMFI